MNGVAIEWSELAFFIEGLEGVLENIRSAYGPKGIEQPLFDDMARVERLREILSETQRGMVNASGAPMDGAARIAAERERQKVVEQYDAEHDASYRDRPGTLAMAGIVYATCAGSGPEVRAVLRNYARDRIAPKHWPWPGDFWKPGKDDTTTSRVRELEKAGALLAAEIDFLLARDA